MRVATLLGTACGLLVTSVDAVSITTFKGRDCKNGVGHDFGNSVAKDQCVNLANVCIRTDSRTLTMLTRTSLQKPQSIQMWSG